MTVKPSIPNSFSVVQTTQSDDPVRRLREVGSNPADVDEIWEIVPRDHVFPLLT
jgi:hypothetical protein